MIPNWKMAEIRDRDARYGDRIPDFWSCQTDRRLLLAEVDRLIEENEDLRASL